MSGWRTWGGYGLVLGLMIVSAGCARREAQPPTPDPEVAAGEVAAEPTESSAAVATSSAAEEEAEDKELRLRGIKLVEDGGQTGVFLKLSRVPDKVENFVLSNPSRIVVDVHGPVGASVKAIERSASGSPHVSRVRAGRQDGKLRITLDLKEKAPKYTVNELKTMVVAFLGERKTSTAPAKSQVLYAEAGATESVAASSGGPRVEMAAVEPPVEEKVTSDNSGRPVAKAYSGQKISLDFKDADILNVLRILSEVGGENIVATDDVKGRITVRLVDVPWDQALDIVLQANRLDSVKIGNVRRVSTVTRLKEEREAALAADQAAKELEPLKTAYIHVNYLKVTGRELNTNIQGTTLGNSTEICRNQTVQTGDQGDKVVDVVKDVLSERGKVRIDARSNTIIVRDIQRGIDAARDLVEKLDIPTPQVLIESNIVEATDTFTRDLGIQWGYSYAAAAQFGNAIGKQFPSSIVLGGGNGTGLNAGLAPGTGTPLSPIVPGAGFNTGPTIGPGSGNLAGAGLPAVGVPFIADFPAGGVNGLSAGNGSAFDFALGSIDGSKALSARISALEAEGKAKVVSRPKVTTANNQVACIASVIISRVRLPSTGVVIGGGGQGAAVAFQEFTTGIILQVVPQVSSDGFVLLQLKVTSSTPAGTQTADIADTIDRQASTTVLIKAGETLVLGGVFRDTSNDAENGIPFFRSIPGLGWLFKRMLRQNTREELLVFLTPRIVQGSGSTITSLPNAKQLWDNRDPVEPKEEKNWRK